VHLDLQPTTPEEPEGRTTPALSVKSWSRPLSTTGNRTNAPLEDDTWESRPCFTMRHWHMAATISPRWCQMCWTPVCFHSLPRHHCCGFPEVADQLAAQKLSTGIMRETPLELLATNPLSKILVRKCGTPFGSDSDGSRKRQNWDNEAHQIHEPTLWKLGKST
jgi:hypothetical protein